MERIETLSDPGAEEARQSHAGRTAFGATRPSADFARDDQRTNTAFGQVVVGRNAWISHEHKEFGQKAFDPFAKGMHEDLGKCATLMLSIGVGSGVMDMHPIDL